jgi:hypothetical protein
MALDTYRDIFGKVLLRCPDAGRELAADWVNNAFREIAEKRRWSWLFKFGQFEMPALYNTGTISATRGDNTITGSGTAWTGDMQGRQFRGGGVNSPIYTITQVNSATSLSLDTPWGAATNSGLGYQIYLAYVTPPSDFHAFVSLWDPQMNWQLYLNVQTAEIDQWDAQRANLSQTYVVSFRDYTLSQVGTVSQPIQVVGSGPAPGSSGNYTGPSDAIFTLIVTTGGASGTAVFEWSKQGGVYTTNVTTDDNALSLSDGVQVYWPLSVTFVQGDTFLLRATAQTAPGLPRYELWPHQTAQYVYPFIYEARATDISDPGAVLPRYIRGDVLLELSLANAARWPGTATNKNPYYDLNLWRTHQMRGDDMVRELERQDDETAEQDYRISNATSLPWAPFPLGDARWLQSHAI